MAIDIIKVQKPSGNGKCQPILNPINLKIVQEINSPDTIEFNIPVDDKAIDDLEIEGYLICNNTRFVVKEINKNLLDKTVEVYGIADIEGLQRLWVKNYKGTYKTFYAFINDILELKGSSWSAIYGDTAESGNRPMSSRNFNYKRMTVYDMMMEAIDKWRVEIKFDTINKHIIIYKKLQEGDNSGLTYIFENFNLIDFERTVNSEDVVNRVYAYGKEAHEESESFETTKAELVNKKSSDKYLKESDVAAKVESLKASVKNELSSTITSMLYPAPTSKQKSEALASIKYTVTKAYNKTKTTERTMCDITVKGTVKCVHTVPALEIYIDEKDEYGSYTIGKRIDGIYEDSTEDDGEWLYEDAFTYLLDNRAPTYTYSIDFLDLALIDSSEYKQLLAVNLGDIVRVRTKTLGIKKNLRVVTKEFYPNAPQNNKITLSTKYSLNKPSTVKQRKFVTTIKDTYSQLASGLITESNIEEGSITSTKIGTAAISMSNIADNCITSDKLVEACVSAPYLAPNAVTVEAIAENAVTNESLDSDSVDTEQIVDGAVTFSKINADEIFSNEITATNFNLTGGTINIDADGDEESIIKLNYGTENSYSTSNMTTTYLGIERKGNFLIDANGALPAGSKTYSQLRSNKLTFGLVKPNGTVSTTDIYSGWNSATGNAHLYFERNPLVKDISSSSYKNVITESNFSTYICNTSTKNGWRVREWSDGTIEAWRNITPTLTFGTSLGNYIHYQIGSTVHELPTTFAVKPNITVTCTDGNLVFATVNALTTSSFKLNYTRLMSGTPSSAERNFCIYVVGRKS